MGCAAQDWLEKLDALFLSGHNHLTSHLYPFGLCKKAVTNVIFRFAEC
jgi:hypothetical protein